MARKVAKKASKRSSISSTKKVAKSSGSKRKRSSGRKWAKKATRVYFVKEHLIGNPRSLVVIDASDPLWKVADDDDTPPIHVDVAINDAIVWITPPHDASDRAIERINRAVANDGAITIKVLPREGKQGVYPSDMFSKDEMPNQTPRELVMEMVEESTSADKGALEALLNEVMGEEGL